MHTPPPNRPWPRLATALALICLLPVMSRGAGVKVGEAFPDLASFQLEGTLPESRAGKIIVVDFWASWCEPCKLSFPIMEDLQKRYRERGLLIIAVNVDEHRGEMEAFLKKQRPSFCVMRDGKQSLVAAASIETMPSTFVIDSGGKVRYIHSGFYGEKTRKEWVKEIESLLK